MTITWIALVCVMTLGVESHRHDPAADREAVRRLEQEWLDARDASTLDRILAEDFVHPVTTGHFLSKRQHIDWAVAHPPSPARKARFEQLDVRLYGDIAIANGIVATQEVSENPIRTVFTDVFEYREGLWRAINAQENEVMPSSQRSSTDDKRR